MITNVPSVERIVSSEEEESRRPTINEPALRQCWVNALRLFSLTILDLIRSFWP